MNTIAVIGSNSFSGSHFVAGALAAGYAVIGLSRSPEPPPVFLAHRWGDCAHFMFQQLDINHDLDRIMAVIEGERPTYVVNFAAQGMVAESWRHPEHWFQTNTLAQVAFHDRLRRCDFLKKYVHISTPEVYGSTAGLVRESTVYAPSTPYSVSRAAADMSLTSFHHAYGFPVVFTRAANVYGPGQQLYRIIPRSGMVFLGGGVLDLHGGGRSIRSFIHIRDVVEATLRVMEKAPSGEIYHVSTDRLVSIRELVELVASIADVEVERHIRVVGDRLGQDAAYRLDSAKIREELGWRDLIALESGLRETLSWINENMPQLKKAPRSYIHKP